MTLVEIVLLTLSMGVHGIKITPDINPINGGLGPNNINFLGISAFCCPRKEVNGIKYILVKESDTSKERVQ